MTFARDKLSGDLETIAAVPSWVTSTRVETLEDVSFLSGAALSQLHYVCGRNDVPQTLLRERMALRAAEVCVGFAGRSERQGALRDAVHFLRDGDMPGPSGEIYLAWRRGVERVISVQALHRAVRGSEAAQIGAWLDAGQGAPVARASEVLAAVLTDAPRSETSALLLADAALAQSLRWEYVLPLVSVGLQRGDLRKRGDDLRVACHRAVTVAATEAVRLAIDLTRRTARLKAVEPKLRAKGAGQAVEMFLTCDAVAPSALPLPDRAARRLCDRLVDLGALRELTGRDTFRLYGV